MSETECTTQEFINHCKSYLNNDYKMFVSEQKILFLKKPNDVYDHPDFISLIIENIMKNKSLKSRILTYIFKNEQNTINFIKKHIFTLKNDELKVKECVFNSISTFLRRGYSSVVDFLLRNGIDVNLKIRDFHYYTLLELLIEYGTIEQMKLLLDLGASVKDKDAWPAFHSAIRLRFLERIKLLVEYGADVAYYYNKSATGPCTLYESRSIEIMDYFFTRIDVNVDTQCRKDKKTFLHYYLEKESDNNVKMFIEKYNPDLYIPDKDGIMPLHIILKKCRLFSAIKDKISFIQHHTWFRFEEKLITARHSYTVLNYIIDSCTICDCKYCFMCMVIQICGLKNKNSIELLNTYCSKSNQTIFKYDSKGKTVFDYIFHRGYYNNDITDFFSKYETIEYNRDTNGYTALALKLRNYSKSSITPIIENGWDLRPVFYSKMPYNKYRDECCHLMKLSLFRVVMIRALTLIRIFRAKRGIQAFIYFVLPHILKSMDLKMYSYFGIDPALFIEKTVNVNLLLSISKYVLCDKPLITTSRSQLVRILQQHYVGLNDLIITKNNKRKR